MAAKRRDDCMVLVHAIRFQLLAGLWPFGAGSAAGFCQGSRHRPWPRRTGLAIWPALTAGWMGMRCVACGSEAVTERPERTAQGYRRFRCRACGKQFNERSATLLNRTQYPSDVIAL